MTFIQAILLGVLQGLTEFLPVSSSGHLAIIQYLFHVDTGSGMLFDVLLHIGTLAAICVTFYKDIWCLIKEFFGMIADCFRKIGDHDIIILNSSYRKFCLMIIVSTIPTGILGFVGKDLVEMASASLLVPGLCLMLTSILLFIADRIGDGRKGIKSATFLNAFEIGMVQGVATLPGLSRSGSTITACLMCGFKKEFAVKYSFIMSIPAVLGAAILEIKDAAGTPLGDGMLAKYIVGMIVAAVVGYVAIKTMIVVVKKKKYIIFSVYCMAVGILAVCGYFLTR